MVRGTVVLPHGLGKTKIVAVIASGDKIKDAEAAGADFVGGEEMVEKIQKEGWTAFDASSRPPDMMLRLDVSERSSDPAADAESEDRHRDHRRGFSNQGDQGW